MPGQKPFRTPLLQRDPNVGGRRYPERTRAPVELKHSHPDEFLEEPIEEPRLLTSRPVVSRATQLPSYGEQRSLRQQGTAAQTPKPSLAAGLLLPTPGLTRKSAYLDEEVDDEEYQPRRRQSKRLRVAREEQEDEAEDEEDGGVPLPAVESNGSVVAEEDEDAGEKSDEEDFVPEEENLAEDDEGDELFELLGGDVAELLFAGEQGEDDVAAALPGDAHASGPRRSTRSNTARKSTGAATSSAKPNKRPARTTWSWDFFTSGLDIGRPGETDSIEDPMAMQRCDDIVKFWIDQRSQNLLPTVFARTVARAMRTLGQAGVQGLLQNYLLPQYRQMIGRGRVQLADILALPTEEWQLNQKGVYISVIWEDGEQDDQPAYEARYVGSGTAEVGVPGMGQRWATYERAERRIEAGAFPNPEGRHLKAAAIPGRHWALRPIAWLPDDVPRAFVCIVEGFGVDVSQTLSRELPSLDSRSYSFQNQDCVNASEATWSPIQGQPTWERLNGANPLMQGPRASTGESVRQWMLKRQGGQCPCCHGPIGRLPIVLKNSLPRLYEKAPEATYCCGACHMLWRAKSHPKYPDTDKGFWSWVSYRREHQAIKAAKDPNDTRSAKSIIDEQRRKAVFEACPLCGVAGRSIGGIVPNLKALGYTCDGICGRCQERFCQGRKASKFDYTVDGLRKFIESLPKPRLVKKREREARGNICPVCKRVSSKWANMPKLREHGICDDEVCSLCYDHFLVFKKKGRYSGTREGFQKFFDARTEWAAGKG